MLPRSPLRTTHPCSHHLLACWGSFVTPRRLALGCGFCSVAPTLQVKWALVPSTTCWRGAWTPGFLSFPLSQTWRKVPGVSLNPHSEQIRDASSFILPPSLCSPAGELSWKARNFTKWSGAHLHLFQVTSPILSSSLAVIKEQMEQCRSKGEKKKKKRKKETRKASKLWTGSFCCYFWSAFSMETYRIFSASPRDPNEVLMYPILQGFSKEASNLATAASPWQE